MARPPRVTGSSRRGIIPATRPVASRRRRMKLAAALLLVAIGGLAGCTAMQHLARRHGVALAEASWQALNAVDFAQTVSIARQPRRYHEDGIPTRWLIGEHPGEGAVGACWAGVALLHLAVTRYLAARTDRGRAWRWTLYGWETLSLAEGARDVARNASIGLQPFGPKRD
jgi:hypothetical protein